MQSVVIAACCQPCFHQRITKLEGSDWYHHRAQSIDDFMGSRVIVSMIQHFRTLSRDPVGPSTQQVRPFQEFPLDSASRANIGSRLSVLSGTKA